MPTDLLPAPRLDRAARGLRRTLPHRSARPNVDHRPHRGRAVRRVALRRRRALGTRDPRPRRGARHRAVLPRRPRHHRSASTDCSRTSRSWPSVRSSSRSSEPVRWPSKVARSAGSPTIDAITSSPTWTAIPHSPHGARSPLHGLWHAHIGWLFNHEPTSWPRHARDLMADRDMVVMNALFPLWCVVSLAIPFALGWILGGDIGAALERAAVGRRRAHLLRSPRDVEHQLALSCVRSTPVRHDRSQHERRRPRAVHHGRVVAQRSSRVPAVGAPRPAARTVGHIGSRHSMLRAARLGRPTSTGRRRPRLARRRSSG